MRVYGDSRLDTWRRALATAPDTPAPEQGFKVYVPDEFDAETGHDRREVRFRITTAAPDRMRDTIDPKGWDLKFYKMNPVVLFAHDYSQLPVARAVKIDADDKGLTSTATFATREQYPFADTVYQLVKGGFLKSVSVGFKPLKHVFNEARGGVDFLEQELLEYSIVPIPANPEALIEAEGKGVDTSPLRTWAECLLDSLHDEPGLWVPRRQVEAMLLRHLVRGAERPMPDPTPPPPAPEPEPEPEPAPAAVARAADRPTFELADDPDDVEILTLDPDDEAITPEMLREAFAEAMPALMRQEMNRLRGRID